MSEYISVERHHILFVKKDPYHMKVHQYIIELDLREKSPYVASHGEIEKWGGGGGSNWNNLDISTEKG